MFDLRLRYFPNADLERLLVVDGFHGGHSIVCLRIREGTVNAIDGGSVQAMVSRRYESMR